MIGAVRKFGAPSPASSRCCCCWNGERRLTCSGRRGRQRSSHLLLRSLPIAGVLRCVLQVRMVREREGWRYAAPPRGEALSAEIPSFLCKSSRTGYAQCSISSSLSACTSSQQQQQQRSRRKKGFSLYQHDHTEQPRQSVGFTGDRATWTTPPFIALPPSPPQVVLPRKAVPSPQLRHSRNHKGSALAQGGRTSFLSYFCSLLLYIRGQ